MSAAGGGTAEAGLPPPSLRPQAGLNLLPTTHLGSTPSCCTWGTRQRQPREVRIMQFCHTLREFALEYRTCRDRVLQQQQKAGHVVSATRPGDDDH